MDILTANETNTQGAFAHRSLAVGMVIMGAAGQVVVIIFVLP